MLCNKTTQYFSLEHQIHRRQLQTYLYKLKIFAILTTIVLVLTTVILDKSQVREVCPHIAVNAVQHMHEGRKMSRQCGGKKSLLVTEGRRWMAAMHGDRLGLNWRDDKCEPVGCSGTLVIQQSAYNSLIDLKNINSSWFRKSVFKNRTVSIPVYDIKYQV